MSESFKDSLNQPFVENYNNNVHKMFNAGYGLIVGKSSTEIDSIHKLVGEKYPN